MPLTHSNHLKTLPPLPMVLTSFVGRLHEMAEIAKSLESSALVSLVGTGGCGKTRLALQVTAAVADRFADGVYWCELARVTDPTLVPQTVANALAVTESADRSWMETLSDALRDKQALLVIDNCEHVLTACARLVEDLVILPQLRILITSREPLGIASESLYPVLPLPYPAANISFSAISQFDAVRLFVERAQRILPSFTLTPNNAEGVGAICRDLDGLPLAIELASSRVNVLTVHQIQERLQQRFELLVSNSHGEERHKTLHATIEWSYMLLSEQEQLLLRRLAVFVAGFTLSTAEAVCAWDGIHPNQFLDLLTSLINKSLVVAETMQGSEAHYHLLESIRQFAQEKWRDLNDSHTIARLHECYLTYYVQRTEEVAPKLSESYQQLWLGWLDGELENLRTALAIAVDRGCIADGMRLATALYRFWEIRGYVREGLTWFEKLLAASNETLPLEIRVNALVYASFLAMFLRDGEKATRLGREALALCEAYSASDALLNFALAALGSAALAMGDVQLGYDLALRQLHYYRGTTDRFNLGMVQFILGMSATALGNYEAARQHLSESLALARQANDPFRTANVLKVLGELARCEGDFARARVDYTESLRLYQTLNAKSDIPDIKRHMAYVFLHEGDVGGAGQLLEEALVTHIESENQAGILQTLLGLAALAAGLGALSTSAQLYGFLSGVPLAKSYVPRGADRITFVQLGDDLKMALGAQIETEFIRGYSLSLEQAVQLGLSVTAKTVPPTSTSPAPDALTPREREVTRLIARGQANAEIAQELVLSKRTVEHHIASIFAKLGFTNRAQVVRWAIENGLIHT